LNECKTNSCSVCVCVCVRVRVLLCFVLFLMGFARLLRMSGLKSAIGELKFYLYNLRVTPSLVIFSTECRR
jgi:hypothetical protein